MSLPKGASFPETNGGLMAEPVKFHSLATIMDDMTVLDPPEAIGYLGWTGMVTLLPAREKQGKSSFIGFDCIQLAQLTRRSLWIAAEEGLLQVVERLEGLGTRDNPGLREWIYIASPAPDSWAALEQCIIGAKPRVVYIDTLGSFIVGIRGLKIPDSWDHIGWQAIMINFKRLAIEYKCAIIVLHHSPKKLGEDSIGSIGITAGVDCIATFLSPDEKPPRVKIMDGKRVIRYRARFQLDETDVAFEWDKEAFAYKVTTAGPSRGPATLINLLTASPGITKQAAMSQLGVSQPTLDRWIKRHSIEKTRQKTATGIEVTLHLPEPTTEVDPPLDIFEPPELD